MKKTLLIIYAVFASLVICFSIGFFAFNIYSEYAHGDLRTQVRFDKFAASVKLLTEKTPVNSKDYPGKVKKLIGSEEDFTYIEIKADGNNIVSFGEIENAAESKLIKNRSKSYTLSGGTILTVSASLYLLRPSSVYFYAKIAFIIILLLTLFTIILILYDNFKHRKDYKLLKPVKITPLAEEEAETKVEKEFVTKEVSQAINSEPVKQAVVEIQPEPVKEAVTEEKAEPVKEEISGTLEKVEIKPVEIKKAELPVDEIKPAVIENEQTSPEGLFSPETGLGWQEYLNTRLNNELNRATASEVDLSVFLIDFPDCNKKSDKMQKVYELLIQKFQFKDLLFEYKDTSVVGISISRTIDEAITFADSLLSDIKAILENQMFSIGITARGIRMITGERLLKEAEEALKHAKEENEPSIIAFRADATKYREYLEASSN